MKSKKSTGLKDINGKNIFVGDILENPFEDIGEDIPKGYELVKFGSYINSDNGKKSKGFYLVSYEDGIKNIFPLDKDIIEYIKLKKVGTINNKKLMEKFKIR
jgi:hypothetical protein